MIVRMRRILTDSLSVPMTMGKGPIRIMPAPFVFVSVFALLLFLVEMAIEKNTIMIPAMIIAMPIKAREVQSGNGCSPIAKLEAPNN